MNAGVTRVSPRWLALREPADAKARARELVERIERARPASARSVIHDLGCGTGAMGRWLAPLLAGPQHWFVHDRDVDLLALATAAAPGPAADGAPVTVEARITDIAGLHARDLTAATLITASALLDLLSERELERLARVCVAAMCPILLTLSVTGNVEIRPASALDRRVAAAFDAHQRRATERGRLLGPDAVDFAVEVFRRLGAEVHLGASPWRLGRRHSTLAAAWFTGWVDAACAQEIELASDCRPYTRRRLEQASAGELAISVGHADLLVLP
jgi:trans-aconitate methyltransferase